MLGAELTVSHHTRSSTSFGYGHVLFVSSVHDLLGSLLVIILIGGVSFCILSFLPSSFVSREISYWLRHVMVL
jgi:sensor histidine kinase YesM